MFRDQFIRSYSVFFQRSIVFELFLQFYEMILLYCQLLFRSGYITPYCCIVLIGGAYRVKLEEE